MRLPAQMALVHGDGQSRKVLLLLTLVYTINFVDRTIIGAIGQAIKVDLAISDAQLGILQGLAFAVLYSTLGIPLARLAERRNRVTIVSISLVVWSAFTTLCGTAQSFLQLLLFRIGVGVGEAGGTPPSQSLIADYYPPERRATAMSIFSFGIPLGVMIGAVLGGWLAQNVGWRAAFIVLGVPGMLLGLVVKLAIKEPPRGYSEMAHGYAHGTGDEPPPLAAVARRLFGRWPFLHMTIAITIISFSTYALMGFLAPFFTRKFALDYATTGLIVGLAGGVSQGIGTLIGGRLADWAAERNGAWYARVPAIGLLIAMPLYLAVFLAPSWQLAAALLLVPGIFHFTYLGPTYGVMHNLVEPRMRATATALVFFVINIIGLAFGPMFTGWAIDRSSAAAFTGPGTFATACPGGVAASQLDVDVCTSALSAGTTRGLIITVLLFAWGAVHYLLASRGLDRDLREFSAMRYQPAAAVVAK